MYIYIYLYIYTYTHIQRIVQLRREAFHVFDSEGKGPRKRGGRNRGQGRNKDRLWRFWKLRSRILEILERFLDLEILESL